LQNGCKAGAKKCKAIAVRLEVDYIAIVKRLQSDSKEIAKR
jgi:hypothetical protein